MHTVLLVLQTRLYHALKDNCGRDGKLLCGFAPVTSLAFHYLVNVACVLTHFADAIIELNFVFLLCCVQNGGRAGREARGEGLRRHLHGEPFLITIFTIITLLYHAYQCLSMLMNAYDGA